MNPAETPLNASTEVCQLCSSDRAAFFYADKKRAYYQCPTCSLVFVPDRFVLPSADEKAVYDLHENAPGDAGYEAFLSRAAAPLAEYLSSTQRQSSAGAQLPCHGLDFGCGPSPVLASMLAAEPYRYDVDVYDLYYFPEGDKYLRCRNAYTFITATEVAEHLHHPLSVFRTLWQCLCEDGGVLVVMTKRVHGTLEKFRNWHYIRDPTHIAFFHEDSFRWLAGVLPQRGESCELRFAAADVVLLIKTRVAT